MAQWPTPTKRAKGKTSNKPLSSRATTKSTHQSRPPLKSHGSTQRGNNVFNTPQSRAAATAFTKVTGEPANYADILGKMYCVVLAKEKLAASGPMPAKDVDTETIREALMAVVGDIGWEMLFLMLAQCARLWAELPGPTELTEAHKTVLHALSSKLGDLTKVGGEINRFSRRH
jgi:hypothetical protein